MSRLRVYNCLEVDVRLIKWAPMIVYPKERQYEIVH